MNTVHFDYKIGDEVTILAIDLTGRVDACMQNEFGFSYRVVYWAESVRRCEWMFAWEIKR